jgi:serine/threonine protein phosphatase 1
MPKTFVIGDIHGAHRALLQCFENSNFNLASDTLICLGDVADGWPETKQAIDQLLKVKHLIYVLGNHDFWTLEWMITGYAEDTWLEQGGQATVDSYHGNIPDHHVEFFKQAVPYHIQQNKLFVHAGIRTDRSLEDQGIQTFLWDRTFARLAKHEHKANKNTHITPFDSVFIGHTPISDSQPVQYCEVWMMDTGAGWSGSLSMMNIETLESFVSNPIPELYQDVKGRQRH